MRPVTKRAVSAAQPPRSTRAGSARPTRHGSMAPPLNRNNTATSLPVDGTASGMVPKLPRSPAAGIKRKERDFELEEEDTNIHVVVRCRGRNDREVQENSGVMVSTEGARGRTVDLSMGPNAISNKTYYFDKVFSPAADQAMVYDDVVAPILDEMISGYNCTIFAYGQTGTGKTYTMSGDITDTLGLSDAAGIIPRTLHSLFSKLEIEEKESTVKVSFIELYNEELRDLLASDDSTKLKLFEADQKKGNTATIVQGMEESHIKSAQDGIRLLQIGSHKRQVAATKCNDLSSRSHTVFTVTVYTKRAGESDEDWVVSGKLNLVDLAGSENIQRSGAENKRAAEAGLINKSLLTLGRVINALVDKASHIPYRESKLTRLLQDSLGGRTKTCIIATISPAKSNLEETISTLDYAFRAKNIRNKPQINQPIPKKTLLREYTAEIQQLKSELIATRQRNGVYLSNNHYEQITVESESRRILSEEQKAKIETMEANLRNKIQDLYSLTNNLAILKKDNESTKQQLDDTTDVLRQTEFVLEDTRQNLEEETTLRKAHQSTEVELSKQGNALLTTLDRTVRDVNGLRAKIRRKSDVQSINKTTWESSRARVSDVTNLVEGRIGEFQSNHQRLLSNFTSQLESFVDSQCQRIEEKERALLASTMLLEAEHVAIDDLSVQSKTDMNAILEEIKILREEVKTEVGAGLQGLSISAGRISAGVIEELGLFHDQLNSCYRAMGKEIEAIFDDLNKRFEAQKLEADSLRQELDSATQAAQEDTARLNAQFEAEALSERDRAANERRTLISRITTLINASGKAQEERMDERDNILRGELARSRVNLEESGQHFAKSINSWLKEGDTLSKHSIQSRDSIQKKLQNDWQAIEAQGKSIEATTRSVHDETVKIVEAQVKGMAEQMQSLDAFVTRARSQNEQHHNSQMQLTRKLTVGVGEVYSTGLQDLQQSKTALSILQDNMVSHRGSSQELTAGLVSSIQQPLSELQHVTATTELTEYTTTGSTPQKTNYDYPRVLAKTALPSTAQQKPQSVNEEPLLIPVPDLSISSTPPSPSKTDIYTDTDEGPLVIPHAATADSLREVPVNISSSDRDHRTQDVKAEEFGRSLKLDIIASSMGPPSLKRSDVGKSAAGKHGKGGKGVAEGRENAVLGGVARLSASVGSDGRRLRSSVRQG